MMLSQWLYRFQWLFLGLLVVVIPTTYRYVMWVYGGMPRLFPEFRGAVIFLPDYFMAAILGVSLVRVAADRAYRTRLTATIALIVRKWGWAWWLLIIWMGLTSLWAVDATLTLYDTFHVALCLALALIIAELTAYRFQSFLVNVFVISGLFYAILALLQSVTGRPLGLYALGEIDWRGVIIPGSLFERSLDVLDILSRWRYRAPALSVNANNLAGYLLICGFATFGLSIAARSFRPRAIVAVMGIVIVGGMLATLSRSAVIALAACGFVWLSFRYPRQLPNHQRWLMVGGTVLLVGVTLAILISRGGLESILMRLQDSYLTETLQVIQTAPFTGVSGGNLMIHMGRLLEKEGILLLPAHNLYLVWWGELGIIGMVIGSVALVGSIGRFWQSSTVRLMIWRIGLLAIALVSIFDYYFWLDHRMRVLLFVVLGSVWAGHLMPPAATPPATEM